MELLIQHTNDKVSLENGSLKYNSMISLRDISSVRIVTILWMHEKSNVLQNVKKIFRPSFEQFTSWPRIGYNVFDKDSSDDEEIQMQRKEETDWQNAKKNVLSKLSRLPIPKVVIDMCWFDSISECVECGLKAWVEHHKPIFRNIGKCFDDIKWTNKGDIDYAETAFHIMQRQRLSLNCRFEMACTYCFEDKVASIFPSMKADYFIDYASDNCVTDKPMLFYFMNRHLKKDFLEMLIEINDLIESQGNKSIEEYVLHCMLEVCVDEDEVVSNHLLVGLKYLWNKLTIEEKSNNIINVIKYCGNNDLRYSILSELNKDIQKQVIEKASVILVDMPNYWHSIHYFLPTIIYIFDILTKDAYMDILQNLIDLIYYTPDSDHISNNVKNFKAIFKVFWGNTPKNLQESLLEKNEIIHHIALLVKENIDLAQLMLYDIQDDKKEEAICSTEGLEECGSIILYNDEGLKLLNVFVECFLCTEEKINMLKNKLFLLRGTDIIGSLLRFKKWNETEFFMKWALGSDQNIEMFKRDIMIRKKFYNEYEMTYPQNQHKTYPLYVSEDDLRCIEKIFSKSIL